MKTPRDYQEKAIQAFFDYFKFSDGNPLIVAPVGAGKSLIMAEICRRACEMYSDTRILILSHVAELLTQDAEELLEQWPDAPIGFCSASLGQKRFHSQILFAGIQTIHKHAAAIGDVDFVLIDEAHLVSPKDGTTYRKFLDELRKLNPKLKVAGLTGTPFRPNQGYLHEGEDALFTHIAYEIPIKFLIDNGYLTPVIPAPIVTQMDTSGVGMRGNDFIINQLEEAVDKDEITEACVDEIITLGATRNCWLVFCVTVKHAEHTADAFRRRGVECEIITGDTPKDQRREILKRYKRGEIKCLINVAVLTTGFNNPRIDLLAVMRPMRSPVLYIQVIGRGMRLFDGKEDCLVLDFGGVIDALGPIDNIKIKPPGEGTGEAPFKVCPLEEGGCGEMNHAAVRECVNCGYKFPEPKPKLAKKASHGAILSDQTQAHWLDVEGVVYKVHEGYTGKRSLKVTYKCQEELMATEFIFPEGRGLARKKFESWWKRRAETAPPKKVDDVIESHEILEAPAQVYAAQDGKYIKVLSHSFI